MVDFFRTYADKCHHGKEEDILFRLLAGKPLSPSHKKVLDELMVEHGYAREAVGKLIKARAEYMIGSKTAVKEIKSQMNKLIGRVQEKGLTLIPLKLYLMDNWVKVDLALAKSKKQFEKRDKIKKKETAREMERALSARLKKK